MSQITCIKLLIFGWCLWLITILFLLFIIFTGPYYTEKIICNDRIGLELDSPYTLEVGGD